MDRKSLNKHDIDTLVSMIEELKIDPLLYKTNGKGRKKGDLCRNKGMLISHIIKHDPPKDTPKEAEPPNPLEAESKEIPKEAEPPKTLEAENKEIPKGADPPKTLESENKMYKWCRMYVSTDNFMSELYTKEEVDKLHSQFGNNKKLIAIHLWSNFSIEQKIKI